ncbi:hypothetical protein ACSQ67_022535 [Phaseolus vulgaris]
MEDLDSLIIYPEGEHELRQKLMDARLELETTKHLKTELFNLLKMAYQERDEARACTSITKSDNTLSHGSPQMEFLFDSSTEFTNINAVNPIDKMSNLNQNLIQNFNFSAPSVSMIPSVKPMCDPAAAVIDRLANERGLPQMGHLLQAVKDAGPLLNTLLLAGQLPTWVNPLLLKRSKCHRIPTLPYSSNALSTCSASMLNLAAQNTASWNNTWQLNSTSGVTSKTRQ